MPTGSGTGAPVTSVPSMGFTILKSIVEERTGAHTRTGDFINAGQLELAKEAQNIERINITFAAGVAAIPTTCLEVLAILWDGERLELKPSDMETDETGTPIWYTVKNGQILLDSQASGTQTLLYIPRPATMAGIDTSSLPDSDNALIAYARYKIYEDLEHVEKATYWENQWYKAKSEWLKGHKRANPRVHKIRRV